jgi:hypothetical protein
LSQVWVRDHHAGGWITVPWTRRAAAAVPFADFTWRAARELASSRGQADHDEDAVARALADLLRRAQQGPQTRRVAARTSVAAATSLLPIQAPPPLDAEPDDHPGDQPAAAEPPPSAGIVPFGMLDPLAESERL